MPSPTIFDSLVLCRSFAVASAFNHTVGSDIQALIIRTNVSFGHLESP